MKNEKYSPLCNDELIRNKNWWEKYKNSIIKRYQTLCKENTHKQAIHIITHEIFKNNNYMSFRSRLQQIVRIIWQYKKDIVV